MVKLLPPVLLFATLALVGASAQSTDDPKERLWNITAECQMVVLPQKAALPLLPGLLDESKIEGAYEKVQQMIASGEAELASHLVVNFRDGERAVSESIEELRYGTEFDPPYLPDSAHQNPAVLKNWPVVGITPTSFETRNVGTTFEIEARVYDGPRKNLKITVVPQHIRFLRWNRIDAGKLANGDRLFVEQPIFHTIKNTSSLFLGNGHRVLLGVHKVPEQADKLEFFLLRVEAKPAAAK